MKFARITGLLLFFSTILFAQDTAVKKQQLRVSAYLKLLNGVSFMDNADALYTNDFLHNRINLRWQPCATLEARAELRTRLFWGDQVRMNPAMAEQLDKDNGLVDLSWIIADHRSLLLHTTLDRASLRWKKKKWEITAGRQRINWGMTTVWNPNDIFNASNYFDFDYEERPGTDGLRVQYFTGALSAVEAAVRPGKKADETTAGLLYRFNRRNYDLQFLAGRFKADWMAGFGWAGGIGDWGFKGEGSYFIPAKKSGGRTDALSLSIAFDRTFKNDNYFTGAFLYSSIGSVHAANIAALPSLELSARQLMPFRYSFLLQGSHAFSALFSANTGIVYSPSGNSLILLPSCSFSLSNNTVADLVAQLFFSEINSTYRSAGNSVFLRIRYDF